MKIWALASQSGYVNSFIIFKDNLVTMEGELSIGRQTVLKLDSSLEPGREVLLDNYFPSPGFLLELRKLGMPAASTLPANRV